MNQRIFELSKQAWEWAEQQEYNDPAQEFSDILEQKFAELIVRECASVAQDFVTVENNKMVEKIHISPWALQDKIKEHFGVEE